MQYGDRDWLEPIERCYMSKHKQRLEPVRLCAARSHPFQPCAQQPSRYYLTSSRSHCPEYLNIPCRLNQKDLTQIATIAKTLGVVLSAIGILTLLEHIDCIDKLKGLRAFIQTIPRELEDLIEEISFVQCALRTISPDMFHFMGISLAEQRLRTFPADLEGLIRQVEKYQVLAGGRAGVMKLALKKEDFGVNSEI
ncbi:hypothetical protein BDV06DRAFT_157691 [Aspergillus oleicola]